MPSDPEIGLVRQARAGSADAFRELVQRHQDSIYGLIIRMVGETTAAEELTQDTFIRAWRSLDRFREESKVSTWLYRIAVNLCRDHYGSRRTRQSRRETSMERLDSAGAGIPSSEPRPDERLEESEMADAFRRALEALDPDHRAAFLLRHQEGLAPAEIAAALGISVANAKVRVHRAREMILAALRRDGHLSERRPAGEPHLELADE